jgi:hypothetical protein
MKTFSVLKYIFLVVGLGLLTGAFILYQNKKAFLEKAVSAQGTVIELLESRSDNSTTYKPLVSFTTKEGRQIEFTSSVSSNPPSYDEGETVKVLYYPGDPKEATINDFMSIWFGPLIVGFLGTVFSLVGFFIILFKNLKQRRSQYLLDNGKRIETKFDSVQFNNSYKVNGRSPFQIYSQWLDTNTNELYVFKSDNIWFDPTDFIKTEEIKVMIDPKNPKKYFMDISFLPKVNN